MPVKPVVMFTHREPADVAAIDLIQGIHARVEATMDTERSAQMVIGISEIGDPCDKCVARKLSGDILKQPSWRAQVGTFIHAGMEEEFSKPALVRTPDGRTWMVTLEQRLAVWSYDSPVFGRFELGGSCDAFFEEVTEVATAGLVIDGRTWAKTGLAVVVDWKTQGTDKLLKKTAKGDIGQTYTVQMNTYGFGWSLQGHRPSHTLLYALPRDNELSNAQPVLLPYDETIALKALARLKTMFEGAEVFEMAYPGEGWKRFIEFQPTASGCFDCPRYQARENSQFLDGMFAN